MICDELINRWAHWQTNNLHRFEVLPLLFFISLTKKLNISYRLSQLLSSPSLLVFSRVIPSGVTVTKAALATWLQLASNNNNNNNNNNRKNPNLTRQPWSQRCGGVKHLVVLKVGRFWSLMSQTPELSLHRLFALVAPQFVCLVQFRVSTVLPVVPAVVTRDRGKQYLLVFSVVQRKTHFFSAETDLHFTKGEA